MPGLPESLAVLRHRQYRLLFGGQAVSLLGDGMINVALAFAVLELGGSGSTIGLVLAARTVPLVASLLVGGVLADRTSPRAVMVAADVVRLGSQGAMAALLIAGAAETWSLALLAGVTGAATGLFNPAATGLLPQVVGPHLYGQANGLRATAMAGGEILGPVVAGVLVAVASPGWAIAIDAGTFAVSAVLLTRLRLPARAPRASSTFLGDLREGWSTFRSRTWLWAFIASVAVGNAVWGAWSVLGPVVADRELGGAASWGLVLAAMGVGGVLGGALAIRAHPRRPMLLVISAGAVVCLPLAGLAAGAPLAPLAVAALVSGVGIMLGNSVWESTLQRHIPAEALARVSAYDWFGSLAFRPLGLIVWGPIAAATGLDVALWLAFAVQLAAFLAIFAIPDVRRLPAYPPG